MTDSPLSVVYLNHSSAASGGAERSLVELLEALSDKRLISEAVIPAGGTLAGALADIHVPTCAAPFSPLRRTYNPVTQLKFLASLRSVGTVLSTEARRTKCHIVHANSTPAAIYAAYAFGRSRIPVIWHCRDRIGPGPIGRWLAGRVTVAIAISESVRDDLATVVGSGKIRLIYNGIQPRRLVKGRGRQEVRSAWGIPPHAQVVGMAAHLVPWKNHTLFVHACARIAMQNPDAHFVIAGGQINTRVPGYKENLQALAARLSIAEKTHFLGHWSDMTGFYHAIDVLCHPAEDEPFGRVVAEAMILGRPVVVSRGSGPAEYVTHGVTGLLAQPGDAEDFADNVLWTLKNPVALAAVTRAAREKARLDLHIDRTAGEVYQLYMELGQ